MSLELLDCLLKLIEKLVLLLLVWPQILLHVESVLESCLNYPHSILVIFVDTQFLIDQVVGFPLLWSELRGEG